MKKLLLIFILMLCIFPHWNINTTNAEDKYVKVIFTTAYVYKAPEVKEENIIAEYKYGTEFLVLESDIQGIDYSYYKIQIVGMGNISDGFILKSHVIDSSIFVPKKELDTNAKTRRDAIVYILNVDKYTETDDIIKGGTRIRLISGYDDSVKYSKIQYVSDEGDIITAYIKTTDIEVSHISRVLIGVIIIAVTSISIILILFGVKRGRRGGIKSVFKKNKN